MRGKSVAFRLILRSAHAAHVRQNQTRVRALISKCLHDDEMLADAHVAAELFTDDLIAADIWSGRNGPLS